jgi:hypothetical protein
MARGNDAGLSRVYFVLLLNHFHVITALGRHVPPSRRLAPGVSYSFAASPRDLRQSPALGQAQNSMQEDAHSPIASPPSSSNSIALLHRCSQSSTLPISPLVLRHPSPSVEDCPSSPRPRVTTSPTTPRNPRTSGLQTRHGKRSIA